MYELVHLLSIGIALDCWRNRKIECCMDLVEDYRVYALRRPRCLAPHNAFYCTLFEISCSVKLIQSTTCFKFLFEPTNVTVGLG